MPCCRAVFLLAGMLAVMPLAAMAGGPGYQVETVAGTPYTGDGGPATQAYLSGASGLAFDHWGNMYIAETMAHRVRKVGPGGKIATLVGDGVAGIKGDEGPATEARLHSPYGLAVDSDGNLYIADLANARVRRVGTDGVIVTLLADDPKGIRLSGPRNLAIDREGNLLISDFAGNRVLRWFQDRTVEVVAGTGKAGYSGDGGDARQGQPSGPAGLAVGPEGQTYITDSGNQCIRVISDGIIRTLTVPVKPGVRSPLLTSAPTGLALGPDGALYYASVMSLAVGKVTPAGVASWLRLTGGDVAIGPQGLLYASSGATVRRQGEKGEITVVAGGVNRFFGGDGGPAKEALLEYPTGVATDGGSNLYVVDSGNHRLRRVVADVIDTLTGLAEADPAPLEYPFRVSVDSAGNVYVADTGNNKVRKVTPDGKVQTVAGTGECGFAGDEGSAIAAQLCSPYAVAAGPAGEFYVADSGNHRIRRVGADGVVTTVAGNGEPGFRGDRGPAVSAQLNGPMGLWVDQSSNLYIADTGNNRIRRVDPGGGVTTVAGSGIYGFGGDSGPAVSGALRFPRGIAVDTAGTLYIADTGNQRIRRVNEKGIIETIAGTGDRGFAGDGEDGAKAQFDSPTDVAVDSLGNIYVADANNNRVRRLSPKQD